jgi:hypothetical protein
MNHEDAEMQVEHNLTKKRRAKPFCFVCTIKKNHDGIPPQICKTQELSLVLCAPPPRLGWEFQFLVPISGTPIGSGIPIPSSIPEIPVGFSF